MSNSFPSGFRRDHPGKIVSLEEHPLEPDKVRT